MTYRTKLLTLLLALGLVAAACGGGTSVSTDENPFGGSSDDSSDDTSAGDFDAASSEDSASSSDDSAEDPSTDSSDDGSSGSSSSVAFCAFAQEREEAEDLLDEVNIFIPEEFQAAFEENAQLLDEALGVAPDEIRGDLQIVSDDLDRVMGQLEEVGYDISLLIDEPELFDELPEAVAAGDRIDDYIRNECGFDPDANESDGPSDDQILEDIEESGNDAFFVREALVQIGIGEVEADCIAQQVSLDEFAMLADGEVPDEILTIFTSCGVSLSDLAEFGGADPDAINDGLADDLQELDELTPEAQSLLVEELVNQGFTEQEAECLSGALFTGDAAGDIFAAIEVCDIPLSRLTELGGG